MTDIKYQYKNDIISYQSMSNNPSVGEFVWPGVRRAGRGWTAGRAAKPQWAERACGLYIEISKHHY